jgi:hypothetical protein
MILTTAKDAGVALIRAGVNLVCGRATYDPISDEYVSLFGKRRPAGDPLDTRPDKIDGRR